MQSPVRSSRLTRGLAQSLIGLTVALGALAALGLANAAGATATAATSQSGCPSAACSAVESAVKAATHVTSVPQQLTPALQSAAGDILFPPDAAGDCGGVYSTVTLPQCAPDGTNPSAPRIALLGDSEAQTWSISVDALARRTGYSFLGLAKTECTMADLETQVPYSHGAYASCPAFRKYAIARINQFNPKILVIATLAEQFYTVSGKAISPSAYTAALVKTIKSLQHPGRQIFVVSDPPHQEEEPPNCLAAHESNFSGCMTSLSASLSFQNDGAWQSALEAATTKAGASYVNVTPWFCSKNTCPLVIRNTEVYLDYGHMTSTYGVFLSGVLQAALGITDVCAQASASSCNTYSAVASLPYYTQAELAALGKT
jgi:hypothetical protein